MAVPNGWLQQGISNLATRLCNLLFPPRCVYCGRDLLDDSAGTAFCAPCLGELLPAKWHGCRRCGAAVPVCEATPETCPQCKNAPLKFDVVITLGGYHTGLRETVLRMKRPRHDALSMAMGRLMIERQRPELDAVKADIIVPVPMHLLRRLARAKNCPDMLAGCLGKALGVPVRRGVLVRCRNTLPQSGLPPSRRLQNVRGAFRIRRATAIQGARVLLIDDVLTTGATCSEAAKMLKQAGAAMVAVAVVARA